MPEHSWLQEELGGIGIACLPCRFKRAGGLPSILSLARFIKRQGIQAVHSHLSRATLQAGTACRLTNTGFCATVHIRSTDPVYKLAAGRGGRLIAVSEFIKGVLISGGYDPRAIKVIYNGSDFGHGKPVTPKALHQKLGLPHGAQLAGVVGRIAADKGQDLVVKALEMLKSRHENLHLVFIGRTAEKDYEEALRTYCQNAGLAERIHWLGSNSDMTPLIDSLDLLLVPSAMESFGLAAVEAMRREKPVIASRVGGLPEVVQQDHTGLLLMREASHWAEAIERLLSHPEERMRMGQQGRVNAEQLFSVEKMVANLEGVYSEVVRQ